MARERIWAARLPAQLGPGYELIRPAGRLEAVYILYNEFAVQSNITSAATYRSADTAPLTRELVIPALKQLVREHYALRLVAVKRPLASDPSREVVWEGQLREIDLDQIVQFVESEEEDLPGFIEDTHNEWFDTNDHTRPMWRLRVINNRHVIWYHNHFMADGVSGYAFHRGLLRILNCQEREPSSSPRVTTGELSPPRHWTDEFPKTFSMLRLLWDVLYINIIRALVGSWLMFADLPVDTRSPQWPERLRMSSPCKTKLHTLRIPAMQVKAITSYAKAQGISFGVLLYTLALSTIAEDLYPKARLGMVAMPVSLRPFTVPAQDRDMILNSASSYMTVQRMAPYREAVRPSARDQQSTKSVHVNVGKTFALARKYRDGLQAARRDLSIVNGLLSWKQLFGTSLEELFTKITPHLWLYNRYSIGFSNLGTFDPGPGERADWRIEDIQFSAAAVRSNWGSGAPMLNVAGVRGGDCVVNCITEAGVMTDSAVRKFLENWQSRLELLASQWNAKQQ